ncbi:hypothetical protein [Nocardia testacea]|uniref:hypothetical protein n=1 Tax=Nocardia testacea TaxID=248551 RepID=UPI0033FABCD4
MGIFGFTWADGGAFVGGALGAAFFGPPGAMLGSAVGSFAGGVWGDDKGGGAAAEEALVAGIGAAGGAWATDLAGKLLKDGIASMATNKLSAAGARRVDRVATKALMPWNSHGGGPIAALGGAFGGYEVSVQARPPVQIHTTDIGNGGCPARMANLRMPADLTGAVRDLYRGLPGYLCDVWQSFGTGSRKAPSAPELPAQVPGGDAGIPGYAAKADQLNAMIAGFAELDARAVELIAKGAGRVCDEGRMAVGSLIDTVNRRAAETPPSGASVQTHTLDLLNDAFGQGRNILSQAVTASDRVAGRVKDLTDEIESLRAEFGSHKEKHAGEHRPQPESSAPSVSSAPSASSALSAPPAPSASPTQPVVPCVVPAPPYSGASGRGGAAAGEAERRAFAADAGTSEPIPPQIRSGVGVAPESPGTVSPPTPWIVAGHQAPDSPSPARVPRVAESAAPIAVIPGWVLPSFVPAAWSGAGAGPGATSGNAGLDRGAGAGGPSGSGTPSGSAASAVPGRTPWTGLATPPMAAVPAVPAGSWGALVLGGRARAAVGAEAELDPIVSARHSTEIEPHGALVDAVHGPGSTTGVFGGTELPR